MPGPPAGPSLRMTTTSPALDLAACVTAAIAASSPSNTRAGPAWWRRSWPASLTTQPSGARLPRRIARPPVGLIGSSSGAHDLLALGLVAASACSPIVWPVTVIASSCRRPASAGAGATTGDAAGVVEVDGDVAAAGLEVAQQRRALADAVEVVDVELDARLARDRQQVQHAVGRAAAGGDAGDRVLQRLLGDDVARAQRRAEHVDHELAGLVGDLGLGRVLRRGPARGHRRDAQHLERHRHRVGGELAAARAGAGARDALELGELLVGHLARRRGRRRPRRRPGS